MADHGKQTHRPTFAAAMANVLPYMALMVIVIAVYFPSLPNPIVFDDIPQAQALTVPQPMWPRAFVRSLSSTSFVWTHAFAGTEWAWHRAVNVALHVLTACLLITLIFQLLRAFDARGGATSGSSLGHHRWLAFGCALIFAIHPVAVYAVAYLFQRSIVLASLCGLAMLLCVLRGLQRQSIAWLAASVLFYFLAFLSKEHAVMLPAVALSLVALLRDQARSMKLSLALTAASYGVVAAYFVLQMKGVIGVVYEPNLIEALSHADLGAQAVVLEHAYARSLITQATLFFRYLLVWTIPFSGWLAIDLHLPIATSLFSPWHVAGAVAFAGYGFGLLYLLLRGPRQWAPVAFALLIPWFLFFTELSAVRAQDTFVLYRSYLWMLGLPIALALATRDVLLKRFASACAILTFLLTPLALGQIQSFSSSVRLWDDALRKNKPDAPWMERIFMNRGMAYLRKNDVQNAIADLNRAVEMTPTNPHALYARAMALTRLGDLEGALKDLNEAKARRPNEFGPLMLRCTLELALHRVQAARQTCEQALALQPNHPEALLKVGVVYGLEMRLEESVAALKKLIELAPQNAIGHYSLGYALSLQGKNDLAEQRFREACSMGYGQACARLH